MKYWLILWLASLPLAIVSDIPKQPDFPWEMGRKLAIYTAAAIFGCAMRPKANEAESAGGQG